MAKQTAVEWIIQWSKENPIAYQSDYHDAIEQAKEMEKEQIQQAFNDGVKNSDDYVVIDVNVINAEIYYNQTFGK